MPYGWIPTQMPAQLAPSLLAVQTPAKYTGSIQYFRGSTGDVWTVPLKEIRVGGRSVPLKSKIAMLGPEQNFIAIPEVMAKRLFEDIPGVRYDEKNNIYNITGGCKDVSSLPDISFLIGDQLFIHEPSVLDHHGGPSQRAGDRWCRLQQS
eukprot:jgi/Botrbrau1/22586/Bobra.176_1s0016.1